MVIGVSFYSRLEALTQIWVGTHVWSYRFEGLGVPKPKSGIGGFLRSYPLTGNCGLQVPYSRTPS